MKKVTKNFLLGDVQHPKGVLVCDKIGAMFPDNVEDIEE
jgi:hypothetical protein